MRSDVQNAAWETYRPELEAFFDGLHGHIEVDFLVSDAMAEALPESVLETASDHDSAIEIRQTSGGQVSLDIVDRRAIAIDIPHPYHDDERIGVVDVKDESFAARIERQFERTWTDAEPLLGR